MANIASTIRKQLDTPEFVKLEVKFEVELSMEEVNEIDDCSYEFWSLMVDNDPEPIIKVIKTDRMLK